MTAFELANANRLDEAEPHLRKAASLYESIGDHVGLAASYRTLMELAVARRDHAQALELIEIAVVHARATGDERILVVTEAHGVAPLLFDGQFTKVLEMSSALLERTRTFQPDLLPLLFTWTARAHLALGDFGNALALASEALDLSDADDPETSLHLVVKSEAAIATQQYDLLASAVNQYDRLMELKSGQVKALYGGFPWFIEERMESAAAALEKQRGN